MIKTNPFRLTPNMYFKIVIRRQFLRLWWIHTLVLLYVFYQAQVEHEHRSPVFLITFGLAYLPAVILFYYFWATSSAHNDHFAEREMTAEANRLLMHSGESSSELPNASIKYVIETSDFFLLYIARSQFVYVPKNAFANRNDLETFRKYIALKT
jgi:hypothetical protein